MKKIVVFIYLLCIATGQNSAQTAAEKTAHYKSFDTRYSSGKGYIGKPVSALLNDLQYPVGSFILIPNYNNPEYGNEFRFSSADINTTSSLIRNNNKELYLIYVKFSPQIKFPTTGFIRENKGKPLSPQQYAEFEKYKIKHIQVSVFPR